MKKFSSQEIKEFESPLFDDKMSLNKDPSWPKIILLNT